ncbi:hypothetical protein [Methylocystis parvus]|uniref:Serine/threonine protein kinase n=1 Tax=Methylocystis parvus TaxID=134 RepID=A0A6B8M251_9HYPH|nr:hypothetical protein [Methylocystis parvus]QGM96428.1 hypothetical protein F7D14_02300 [Methylocystis parvus]WBJ99725.1 hypothetical protein MMG94_17330 [Methylocystis parvus OBBP]
MKKLLIGALALSSSAFAPAVAQQAQDQGDPNPPAIQGAPRPDIKPALNEETGRTPSAIAEQSQAGDTSGPAAGGNVTPPTVVQKENPAAQEHASPAGVAGPSGTAAGSPGIEAKRGTQAGREWLPPEEVQRKKPSM